eukprot:maker-scaffold144_size312663-snap-gene-1.13 protein:Tk07267 transcript:maker-scaffold144_size312663-snap-gene-1.13-mRNA-1 annotation:"hypothetical protein T265_06922"
MHEDPETVKVPTRVEWENEAVGVFIEDDDEALLMTAQDGYVSHDNYYYHNRTEELFGCLQKLVIASMSIGLIGLGVAFIFLVEYIAGW